MEQNKYKYLIIEDSKLKWRGDLESLKDAVQSHLSMRSLESPTKYVNNVHLAPVVSIAFSTRSRALFMQRKDGG